MIYLNYTRRLLMNKNFRLYPYGFLLSKTNIQQIPDYYKHKYILGTYHFNYDNSYGLKLFESAESFILIHGHFQYVGNNDDLKEEDSFLQNILKLYYSKYETFLEALDFIAGRYCIIIGGRKQLEVFQDASGARSIYYTTNDDYISSHANLISDATECEPFEFGTKSTYPRFSFDNSPYKNVKALVPNFKLKFPERKIERFFPRQNNKYTNMNDKEKVSLVENLWKKQLEYYYNNHDHLLVSITGGNDSRISLALARKLKDNLEFFTYCKNPVNINPSIKRETVNDKDRIIVEKILKDISLNHQFIYYDDRDLEISKQTDYILSRNSIAKHGRFLINLYLKNFPNNHNMHLRGTCLEIVQSVYVSSKFDSSNETAVLNRYLKTAEKFFHLLSEDSFKEIGLNGIKTLGYDKDQYDFHVLDLYYWEHRMGRWHPELLNETDIAFDTFLPFNLRAILEIGMSFTFEKRKSGYLFKELINNSYPILNFYGVNNIHNIYEQNKLYLNDLNKASKINTDIQKNKIITKYDLFQANDILIDTYNTSDNTLKIPYNYISDNNYSKTDITFSLNQGYIEMSILSKYNNQNATDHLKYQILVNNKVVLEEDMSSWDFDNSINIYNLVKNDVISIKVLALKNLTRKSWEKASILEINKLNEIEYISSQNIIKNIMCTSPHSIIL